MAGAEPGPSSTVPRFALFAPQNAAVAQLLQQHPNLLDPLVRPPLHAGGMWLVRPDGYVACASTAAAAIGSYLDRLTSVGAIP